MAATVATITELLKELRQEVRRLDSKFDSHVNLFHSYIQKIKDLRVSVDRLEQTLVRGNGQKPVLTRLEVHSLEIATVKEDVELIRADILSMRDKLDRVLGSDFAAEASRSQARWVAVAKLVGLALLILPGVVAWLKSIAP